MRRNPTNKLKPATEEISATIKALKETMADSVRFRMRILDFMGDASFLTNAQGDVIAQRICTKTGGQRLELT